MAGSDSLYVDEQQSRNTGAVSEGAQSVCDGLLARWAQDGDRDAFMTLTERYSPVVVALFYGKAPFAEIEDLLQDTLLTAFERLESLRDSKRFKPWLLKIARPKLVDFHRKRRHREIDISDEIRGAANDVPGNAANESDERTIADTIAYRELARAVRETMGSMSENYRVVLFLRLIEQMTRKEIAALLGLKESTIRMRLSRGLIQLRKKLERAGIGAKGVESTSVAE